MLLYEETASLDAVNEELVLDVAQADVVAFGLSGTWVGTVTFAVSVDGTNYTSLAMVDSASTTLARATTATTNQLVYADVKGFTKVRARCTAYTSGTIVVKGTTARAA